MERLILIAVGSGVGGVCRYLMSTAVLKALGRPFPFGTLAVNTLGSFLIGFIFIVLLNRFAGFADQLRALLIVGFLGGFTTFSSFSFETITLLENGEVFQGFLNIVLSVLLCLMLTWLGMLLGRLV